MGFTLPEWSYFVDESGDFSNADDGVIAGGLLMRQGVADTLEPMLLTTLRECIPHLPWPHHHAYVKFPVVHALGALATRASDPVAKVHPGLVDWAPRARDALKRAGVPGIDDFVLGLQFGRYPPHGKLSAVDKRLQRLEPVVYERLRNFGIGQSRVWIKAILGDLGAKLGAPESGTGLAMVQLVAAAEAPLGRCHDARLGGRDPGYRRYEDVLLSALQRVADLLGRSGEEQLVNLHVLTRHGPAGADVDLPYLRALARRVVCQPGVELRARSAPAFDANVHPVLVLVDYLCMNLRRPLTHTSADASRPHDLANLGCWVSKVAGLPVMVPSMGLGRLAAAGEADRLIHLTRGSEDTAWTEERIARWVFSSEIGSWCIEQAHGWARALAEGQA